MSHTFEQLRDEFRKLQEQMHRFWVAMEHITGDEDVNKKERRRPGRPAAASKTLPAVQDAQQSEAAPVAPRRRGRPAKVKPAKVSTGRGGPGKKRGPRTTDNWQTRIEGMLRETGKPLTANELSELLAPRVNKRALEIKNVINSTTAMMRREGKLDFIPHVPGKKRGKYALAGGSAVPAGEADNNMASASAPDNNDIPVAVVAEQAGTTATEVSPQHTDTVPQPAPQATAEGNEFH